MILTDHTLYDYARAPNPMKVNIYLAEKGIDVERVQINLSTNQHQMDEAHMAINPLRQIPMLVVDDIIIYETAAICRYFEAMYPREPLFGDTPIQQARIEMWRRRVEFTGLSGVDDMLKNFSPHFKDRAVSGSEPTPQIPELVQRGKVKIERFYNSMEQRFSESEYVAGKKFTVADIEAYVVYKFAPYYCNMSGTENYDHARRWYEQLESRPAFKQFKNMELKK